MSLARVIEALLFSAQKPLSAEQIVDVLGRAGAEDELVPNEFARVRKAEVAAALEERKTEYIEQQRAFQLVEKAEGWQLVSDPVYAKWVRQLFPAPKPTRLSAAALETLAIIAYRQPITRADVEAVRGGTIDRGYNKSVAVALSATFCRHDSGLFALRTTKRLQRARRIRSGKLDDLTCRDQTGRLRAGRQIFGEQSRHVHARDAKRSDDFRA